MAGLAADEGTSAAKSATATAAATVGRRLFALAACSTIVVALALTWLTLRSGPFALIADPGARGPSAAVFHADFPSVSLDDNVGHDGQQFYAIARNPWHPKEVAPHLDRPRYRMQRIFMPALAWTLHPQGGGFGLVVALFVVAAFGALLTGWSGAFLALRAGASVRSAERLALLLPVLPGSLAATGLVVADGLALGLALTACLLDDLGRRRAAIVVGTCAVLTKEPAVLLLLGWTLARGRRSVALTAIPAGIAAVWWAVLRIALADPAVGVKEFAPLVGMVRALASTLTTGADVVAALVVVTGMTLGIIVIVRRGRRSPFGPMVALQLAFTLCLAANVLGPNWNAPRVTAPLLAVSLIALCVPARGAGLVTAQPTSRSSRLSS